MYDTTSSQRNLTMTGGTAEEVPEKKVDEYAWWDEYAQYMYQWNEEENRNIFGYSHAQLSHVDSRRLLFEWEVSCVSIGGHFGVDIVPVLGWATLRL